MNWQEEWIRYSKAGDINKTETYSYQDMKDVFRDGYHSGYSQGRLDWEDAAR